MSKTDEFNKCIEWRRSQTWSSEETWDGGFVMRIRGSAVFSPTEWSSHWAVQVKSKSKVMFWNQENIKCKNLRLTSFTVKEATSVSAELQSRSSELETYRPCVVLGFSFHTVTLNMTKKQTASIKAAVLQYWLAGLEPRQSSGCTVHWNRYSTTNWTRTCRLFHLYTLTKNW